MVAAGDLEHRGDHRQHLTGARVELKSRATADLTASISEQLAGADECGFRLRSVEESMLGLDAASLPLFRPYSPRVLRTHPIGAHGFSVRHDPPPWPPNLIGSAESDQVDGSSTLEVVVGPVHPLFRRPTRANLVGIDFEVVVGRPEVSRNEAFHLADYSLGLYAAPSYLETHQAITEPEQVQEHPLVYFVESMQDVPELTNPVRHLPRMRQSVGATSSMVHVELTRAGAGIGLLPCYMAERAGGLVRLFPDDLTFPVSYWVVSRPDLMRRPAVHAVLDAIRGTVDDMRDELIAAPPKGAR